MTQELETFKLEGGETVRCGLLLPTEEQKQLCLAYPEYGENFYLEKNDIRKALQNDVYKTFRRLRSPWITNQADMGACGAFAEVNAQHNRRGIQGLPHVVLSAHYLYMNINGGRDNGSALVDSLEFSKKGIAPRELDVGGKKVLFPAAYNKNSVSASIYKAAAEQSVLYRSYEAYRLPSQDYSTFSIALASALARDHQVVFAWHVGRYSNRLKNGYVVTGNGPGNHANVFHSGKWVDGEDLVHPDGENSWGPTKNPLYGPLGAGWGEDGFGLFTMQQAYQCARNHTFWVYTGNVITKESL